jgi:DDE_Tnp_1-associated
VVTASILSGLSAIFSQLSDPRKKRGVRHPFQGVVALVFLGLLGRITEMAVLVRWADAHWEDLREPLGFTREKPPCDTTISRILAKLSLDEFRKAFSTWLKSALADHQERWTAAIDGKTCKQGLDAEGSPVQMLNVFLHAVKVTLDQWSIGNDKTNEPGCLKNHLAELLAAYPALQLLTGDAIFAQRPLLDVLATEGRDYLFQIKANQPEVFNALKLCFAESSSKRPAHETTVKRGVIAKPAGFGSTSIRRTISASV